MMINKMPEKVALRYKAATSSMKAVASRREKRRSVVERGAILGGYRKEEWEWFCGLKVVVETKRASLLSDRLV